MCLTGVLESEAMKSINVIAFFFYSFSNLLLFFSNFSNICFSASSSWVLSVSFDSNDILASGSGDSTIKLWNKNTGGLLRTLSGHGSWVRSVASEFFL